LWYYKIKDCEIKEVESLESMHIPDSTLMPSLECCLEYSRKWTSTLTNK
jgi:hypothetical protein